MSGWTEDFEGQRVVMAAIPREEAWPEGVPKPRVMRNGELLAIVGREPVDEEGVDVRWHISIQHEDRVPSWDELAAAGHALRPGVVFVIGVPPRSWWINVHEHVLHLWELRDENLCAQWRFERQGDRPT